jgi:hypothetical protein
VNIVVGAVALLRISDQQENILGKIRMGKFCDHVLPVTRICGQEKDVMKRKTFKLPRKI